MQWLNNNYSLSRGPCIATICALAFFSWNIARFFPNGVDRLGYDYGLFMPWFTAGYFWQTVNGPLTPAEYIPSFCGGVPFLFNPQSVFWSLPQALMAIFTPLTSLIISWIFFGLIGAGGMYALLRRVYAVSMTAALLGSVIFLLNGFYTMRMIIGHVTFHGIMLLPLIALLVFAQPTDTIARRFPGKGFWPTVERIAGPATHGLLAGLLLAYLFYSGGTNTILPMMLAMVTLAVLLICRGGWHRGIAPVAVIALLLCLALCTYKLLPALAFASNVTRPTSLRMTGNLVALAGGAVMSLFAPQALAFLPADKLVLDRVEFEYGVGIVPLLILAAAIWTAIRRRDLTGRTVFRAWPLVAALTLVLAIPILLNWDALGLRWLVLHLPIVKMMSVMLRFWFVYIPFLCVLTALLMDYLIAHPGRRARWVTGAIALTIAQAAATDMTFYETQGYDPAPLLAAYSRVAAGAKVPQIERIADPWMISGGIRSNDAGRNAAMVEGTSSFPCYEPMFGYRMEVFRKARLATGPVLEERGQRLNLKNPTCYTYPEENSCRPGDEFTSDQRRQAEAFRNYRPFDHIWPIRQYAAAYVSLVALALSLLALASFAAMAIIRKTARSFAKPAASPTPDQNHTKA